MGVYRGSLSASWILTEPPIVSLWPNYTECAIRLHSTMDTHFIFVGGVDDEHFAGAHHQLAKSQLNCTPHECNIRLDCCITPGQPTVHTAQCTLPTHPDRTLPIRGGRKPVNYVCTSQVRWIRTNAGIGQVIVTSCASYIPLATTLGGVNTPSLSCILGGFQHTDPTILSLGEWPLSLAK